MKKKRSHRSSTTSSSSNHSSSVGGGGASSSSKYNSSNHPPHNPNVANTSGGNSKNNSSSPGTRTTVKITRGEGPGGISNGNMNVSINMGGQPFTPQMMRELLAPGGPLAQVAARTAGSGGGGGVVSSGSITFNSGGGGSVTVSQGGGSVSGNVSGVYGGCGESGGGNSKNSNNTSMSQEEAMAAQRYLQSLSQLLSTHFNTAGGGPMAGSGKSQGSNSSSVKGSGGNPSSAIGRAVFGPMPPPPPQPKGSVMGLSATINSSGKGLNSGNRNGDGFDFDASSVQTLESLSNSLMAHFHAGKPAPNSEAGVSNCTSVAGATSGSQSSANNPPASGPADVNIANLQQILNSMSAAAVSDPGDHHHHHHHHQQSNQNCNSKTNNNNTSGIYCNDSSFQSQLNDVINAGDPEELKTIMTLFMDAMGLTNSHPNTSNSNTNMNINNSTIGKDMNANSTDAQKLDALGMAFYEKFLKDGAAMTNMADMGGNYNANSNLNASTLSSVMAAMGAMGAMTPHQMQAEHAALRKAAFTAGVNVAIQQQKEQEKIHMQERMDRKNAGFGGSGKAKNKSSQSSTSSSAGSTNSNVPVFSVLFGGNNNGGHSPTPLPAGAVPPLPPPPGGWPPGAPSAAAVAAAAAFASSISHSSDGGAGSTSTSSSNRGTTNANTSVPLSDFPISATDFGSSAWLDYYDACLRAGGISGGITDFEDTARLASLAAAMRDPPPSAADGPSSGKGSETIGNNLPQDRPVNDPSSTSANGDGDDGDGPEGFEYEDRGKRKKNCDFGRSGVEAEWEGDDVLDLNEEQRKQLQAEEEEKRAKKAAKKRDKKARKKERAKKEAEAKAASAALKKREKTISSWRSRVVQACMGGDALKMDLLIGESPYRNYIFDPSVYSIEDDDGSNPAEDQPQTEEEYFARQLEWFLPNCLQKYSNDWGEIPFPNNIAREKLSKYILSVSSNLFHQPCLNQVRSAIHEAAYNNDPSFIRWVIESKTETKIQNTKSSDKFPVKDYLEKLCYDGGWTPLHYAVAAGSESVVELLLENGCDVHARTDSNLMSYVSTGEGITARELASYLQCDNEDDELTCNGDILDEVLESRIFGAPPSCRDSFMEVLSILQERLEDVEVNGYSPPKKIERGKAATTTVSPRKSTTNEKSSQTTANKKSKKKKKKQPASTTVPAPTPAPAPVPPAEESNASKHDKSDDDDLSDPVAVALLGMGFTADQIKAAADALGGFERATADDMVMWILSGGELNEDDQNSSSDDQDDNAEDGSNDAFLTKSQKKAAVRAQREAEEAARKHQEELAAAQRAAAKREEQRRIRREWNEREQQRQLEEKNAKIAEALEKQRLAELEKLKSDMPPKRVTPIVPPPVQITAGNGPPRTIVAGQKFVTNKNASSNISSMGIPKAPVVKSPTILTRPGNIPLGAMSNPNTQSVSKQPLFPQSMSPTAPTSPTVHSPGKTKKLNKPGGGIRTNVNSPQKILHPPLNFSRRSQSMPQDYHTTNAPNFVHDNDTLLGQNTYNINQRNPILGGINRTGGAVPPPGFQPDALTPVPPNLHTEPPAFIESNPMGQIRATAREFVPTSFKPPPAPSPFSGGLEFNVVPSMSSQSVVSPSAPITRTTSIDQTSSSTLLDPMSSLLVSVGPTNTRSSMKVESPVPSAASSITGLSGLVEDNMTSRIGSSVMTFNSAIPTSTTTSAFHGSSILDSIGGIWGGTMQQSSLGNTTSAIGGIPGLNFSSFLGDTNNNSSLGNNGESDDNRGSNAWGTSSDGFGGGRSIW
ncbi:hypothetical protein ACHAXS_009644 [Conticribra weissflogii]